MIINEKIKIKLIKVKGKIRKKKFTILYLKGLLTINIKNIIFT